MQWDDVIIPDDCLEKLGSSDQRRTEAKILNRFYHLEVMTMNIGWDLF